MTISSDGGEIDSDIDWFNHVPTPISKPPKSSSIMSLTEPETPYDRKMRMLLPMAQTCMACSMCELGLKPALKGRTYRDPHVLSNMNPTRFMIVGQNPGWNELESREPFVGQAGKTFNSEIAKHGLSRDNFYICNMVRCYTENNDRPTLEHISRCEPFLRMEIALLKPRLVITLGAVAFQTICPGSVYADSLKTIVKSERFGVKVFPIYHPSPLNLSDADRRVAFQDQIMTMCGLVKAIIKKDSVTSSYPTP